MARHFRGARPHRSASSSTWTSAHTNGWRLDDVVPAAEIVAAIDAELPLEPVEPNYRGEVAERWRYRDGSGEVGVIASVTQPFCGDCTRARLSAEGQLYTCLFAVRGHDLRALVRCGASDEELATAIGARSGGAATDRYSELRTAETRRPAEGRDVATSAAEPAPAPAGTLESASRGGNRLAGHRHDREPSSRSGSRYLPRGWRDFGLPARDLVRLPRSPTRSSRGIADRNPTRAFENGLRRDRHRGARRRPRSS